MTNGDPSSTRRVSVTERIVEASGVQLCTQPFGEGADPPILLIMGVGASMLWWEEGFCRMLADGGRFVIRYDHRDTGRSVTDRPAAPGIRARTSPPTPSGCSTLTGSRPRTSSVSRPGAASRRSLRSTARTASARSRSSAPRSRSPAIAPSRRPPRSSDASSRLWRWTGRIPSRSSSTWSTTGASSPGKSARSTKRPSARSRARRWGAPATSGPPETTTCCTTSNDRARRPAATRRPARQPVPPGAWSRSRGNPVSVDQVRGVIREGPPPTAFVGRTTPGADPK
jgi:hypothetical protein